VESHYGREGDCFLIEIRLRDIRQLYNSLDPAPFLEKDLDKDAEDYIVDSVRDFPLPAPLKLIFHLPGPEQSATPALLAEAVHHYFRYRTDTAARQLKYTLQQGRISLAIGVSFLCLCVVASELIHVLSDGVAARIFREGLLICGWVAMWKPLQIFLYDWWPVRYMKRIYAKLSAVPIEVRWE
jgi:hypothetical protein